jgi:hypothetical protein
MTRISLASALGRRSSTHQTRAKDAPHKTRHLPASLPPSYPEVLIIHQATHRGAPRVKVLAECSWKRGTRLTCSSGAFPRPYRRLPPSYGGIDTLDEPITATIVCHLVILLAWLTSMCTRVAIYYPYTTNSSRCCIPYAKVPEGKFSGS